MNKRQTRLMHEMIRYGELTRFERHILKNGLIMGMIFTILSIGFAMLYFSTLVSAQLNVTWNAFPTPNITSINTMFTYNNTVTGDWFSSLLVLGLWVVMLLVFSSKAEITSSLAASSIISTVLSVILRTNSLVPDWLPMTFIVLSVISILLSYRTGSGY